MGHGWSAISDKMKVAMRTIKVTRMTDKMNSRKRNLLVKRHFNIHKKSLS